MGDHRGDRHDRIAVEPAPDDMDALVHLAHEFVEMDAALRHRPGEREELVHQHGLAAPDRAVDVEPARLGWAGAEEPADEAIARRRLSFGERPVEQIEPGDDGFLCRIAADRAGRDQLAIASGERSAACLPRAHRGHADIRLMPTIAGSRRKKKTAAQR